MILNFQAGRLNGDCIKLDEDHLRNGRQFERDVKDGRQFERDILIKNSETKCHHYPPLDTIDTMSLCSDVSHKV